MFLNYVNSDDIFGQINVNRLIYRTSTLLAYLDRFSAVTRTVEASEGTQRYSIESSVP